MNNVLPPPLSSTAILEAIHLACSITSNDTIHWEGHGTETTQLRLLCSVGGRNNPITTATSDEPDITAYFYFAYSTWDGRILYIDKIVGCRSNNETYCVYKLLANIATTLNCRRLNWQHTKENTALFPGTIQPQTMHGWLTLYWNRDSINKFLSREDNETSESTSKSSSSIQNAIISTIDRYNQSVSSTSSSIRRLRLATENDVDIIRRLVQGLADFEKEPDAVNVTVDQYRLDGFLSDIPLFYCILLEVQEKSDNDKWYACGMAFCWIGQVRDKEQMDSTIKEPLFLYLEDLFIEESYRGNGAGTAMMTALGEITLALNCKRMVWQALDWNTPALTFYQKKVGAYIVDGLLTTRFAGSTLVAFHEST